MRFCSGRQNSGVRIQLGLHIGRAPRLQILLPHRKASNLVAGAFLPTLELRLPANRAAAKILHGKYLPMEAGRSLIRSLYVTTTANISSKTTLA
jgi:hypothetical protein